jgi:CheY-like chemotaxis protein
MLITDDDRDLRETLGSIFEPRGFQTLLASDGKEALDIVQHVRVHVVLIDMHMPRMNGLEMIREVKRTHAKMPCILISAALDEHLAEQARLAHVFSQLAKPINLFDVTETVGAAMRQTYGWPA